jgi:hypothetical protein
MTDQTDTGGSLFLLPRFDGEPSVSYEALELPIAMEKLVAGRPGAISVDELRPYIEWVQARWSGRAWYGLGVFKAAGFGPPENPADAVAELEGWLLKWLPFVYQPDAGGWTTDRIANGAATIVPPGFDGFDPAVHRLTASLIHDIAFAVISYLPANDVTWMVKVEQVQQPKGQVARHYPGLEGYWGEPIGESYSTLLGALSRPGSLSDTVLNGRRASGWCRLCELYEAMQVPT